MLLNRSLDVGETSREAVAQERHSILHDQPSISPSYWNWLDCRLERHHFLGRGLLVIFLPLGVHRITVLPMARP